MTFIEQIKYECSKQRLALHGYWDVMGWSVMPFCRNAEYYFYYALLNQTQPKIITQTDSDENKVRCFLKNSKTSLAWEAFKLEAFPYGESTCLCLEGPYAGIITKTLRDGSIDRGRYLFDTCTRVPEKNNVAQYLRSLPPHTFIDAFLLLLQEKGVSCDEKLLRENSIKYSAWIRRKTKKELL